MIKDSLVVKALVDSPEVQDSRVYKDHRVAKDPPVKSETLDLVVRQVPVETTETTALMAHQEVQVGEETKDRREKGALVDHPDHRYYNTQ